MQNRNGHRLYSASDLCGFLECLSKLRLQARLQFQGRSSDHPLFERLPASGERRGFSRMPRAAEGDLFFDMEGNPLEEGGLEYLFGLYIDAGAMPTFLPFWAHSRDEEKVAFEWFIDWVVAHLKRYPDAHIYHYASYEETAIKRLMSQHGTREAQVDGLLRNGEVTNAGARIVFYERWKETGEMALLEQIERCNEDDVRSRNRQLHSCAANLAGHGAQSCMSQGLNILDVIHHNLLSLRVVGLASRVDLITA